MRMRLLAAPALVPIAALAQTVQDRSLCKLQEQVAQGEHLIVRVSGVFSVGPERSTLDDPACPVSAYQSTWVILDSRTKDNKKLRRLLEDSQRVYLVAEGEFYGPPTPDPKLPEVLQKGFRHTGGIWDVVEQNLSYMQSVM